MFKENNARQGFVEQDDFSRMASEAHLDGLWMRTLIEVAYTYGWRRGEILVLQVRQVDLCARTKPTDAVFTREGGKPIKDFRGAWRNLCVRAGTGHWECRKCGVTLTETKCECGGGRKYVCLIPHDFRQSAAKAARRAGVPESVIMAIGGGRRHRCFLGTQS